MGVGVVCEWGVVRMCVFIFVLLDLFRFDLVFLCLAGYICLDLIWFSFFESKNLKFGVREDLGKGGRGKNMIKEL